MNNFSKRFYPFLHKNIRTFFTLVLILGLLCFFTACTALDYFSYVSELRSNIFLAETENFSMRIYSVTKEVPFVSDGVPRELSTRTEVYLIAPSGDKTCEISFSYDGKTYGGEMSFDNVKTEYYYACTLDVSSAKEIVCHIQYGENTIDMTAYSVLDENTITPRAALDIVRQSESELFETMTDKYGFTGEIYLRLLYEDSPYYYIGIIDRNGNTAAYLLNAQTGKILARRQS